MKNKQIRLTRFELYNYAPLFESMGIKEFKFDRTTSENHLVLILGQNGSGKTYVLTELSPEPLEHLQGRTSNRFIEGLEGKKVVVFRIANANKEDQFEYTCTIIYSADRRKTVCSLYEKNLITGEERELNENGNVSSYMEACEKYLGYTKNYKNIGYISDEVKNIVKMSFSERQQLISSWLPNTAEFLTASKIAQKKKNQFQKEIDGLLRDIAKISSGDLLKQKESEEEKLIIKETKLGKVKDGLSKASLVQATLSRYTREQLILKKTTYLNKVKAHEERFNKNKESFTKYSQYIGVDGRVKLERRLTEIDIQKEGLLNKEKMYNQEIFSKTSKIESMKVTENPNTQGQSLISVTEAISKTEQEIETVKNFIAESIKAYIEFGEFTVYKSEIKDAITSAISCFMNIAALSTKIDNLCGLQMFKSCFDDTGTKVDDVIAALLVKKDEYNKQIEMLTEKLHLLESSSIDFNSIKDSIPKECSEHTCSLIKLLLERSKDGSASKINQTKDEIEKINISIEETDREIEKNRILSQNLQNAMLDVDQIINSLNVLNGKSLYLPSSMRKKIDSTKVYDILESVGRLLEEARKFDEYVSLLEKLSTLLKSLENLKNVNTILTMNAENKRILDEAISERKRYIEELKATTSQIELLTKEKEDLIKLHESVSFLTEEKHAIIEEANELEKEKQQLLKEAEYVYNNRMLNVCISGLRELEFSLNQDCTQIKLSIEQCKTKLTSLDVLNERKTSLEVKRDLSDLLYQVWSSKGYPSLLINDFLSEVLYSANKDLDSSWGGMLNVADFDLKDTALVIPIQRGNTKLEDVGECSKAEKATMSLALSFGIIDASTKDKAYNIVKLDEVDSGMDVMRRQTFLESATSRLDEIGVENVFCVTHSNCFENVSADVILLKGWDSMVSESSLSNKNIIYRFDKSI